MTGCVKRTEVSKMNNELEKFKNIKTRKLGIWFLLSVAILIVIFVIASLSGIDIEDPTIASFFASLWFYGTLLSWVFYEFKQNNLHLENIIGKVHGKKDFFALFLVFPLFILSIGSFLLLFWGLSYLFPIYVQSVLNEPLFLTAEATKTPFIYNALEVFLGLIAAPIIEEIFFRGILLHRWSLKWGIKKALIFSSILFGILHASVVGGFLFGLLMGVIYIKTKNLIIPIIFHMLNNLFAYLPSLISLYQGNIKPETYSLEAFQAEALIGLLFAAIAAPIIFYYLYKNFPTNKTKLP